MKYLLIGAFLIVLSGCDSHSDQTSNSVSGVAPISANSSAPIPKALSGIVTSYLQMKNLFPSLSDTRQLKAYAGEMMVWADSLTNLAVTLPAPLNDSMHILSMAISDELKGLMEEGDRQGLSLSFQMTGLQLYDLLRMMAYSGRKIYLFQSLAGGEGEASWLDITPVSSHPFRESREQVKAVDSISVQ